MDFAQLTVEGFANLDLDNATTDISTTLTTMGANVETIKDKMATLPDAAPTITTVPTANNITIVSGDDYIFDPIVFSSTAWHSLEGAVVTLCVMGEEDDVAFEIVGTVTLGTTQTVTFSPNHEDTSECDVGAFPFDVTATWTVNGEDVVKTLVRGTATVLEGYSSE